MAHKPLSNPPLVEVIVEVRWELEQGPHPETKVDPHYKLLPGKLFDKLSGAYPYHEELPQASLPDEISPYMVKHRFRCEKDQWPLVQLGPGILTVNHTKKYKTFNEFCPLAVSAVNALFEVHPGRDILKMSSLLLRYIDAKEFDYKKNDVVRFLGEKMGIPLSLPPKLFNGTGVEDVARSFSWNSSFPCNKPKGLAILKFATGMSNGKPALIWEQIVKSVHDDAPEMPDAFEDWITEAHEVTESWFLSLIEGELEREFDNG